MASRYQGPKTELRLYEAVVATKAEVERKGATVPYTSQGGHMFSFLDKTGSMALRLPTELREAFLEKYVTTIAEQYGKQMKEFVVVPSDLLARTPELADWFDKSFEWVASLKPKPTKRG